MSGLGIKREETEEIEEKKRKTGRVEEERGIRRRGRSPTGWGNHVADLKKDPNCRL